MKSMRVKSLLAVLALLLLTSVAAKSRRASDELEDDFGEFDNFDADEPTSTKRSDAKQVKQPVQQQQATTVATSAKSGDFDELSIEEEFDDEFEGVKETKKRTQASPTQEANKSKTTQDPTTTTTNNNNNNKQQAFSNNLGDDLDMEEFEHFVDEEEFEGTCLYYCWRFFEILKFEKKSESSSQFN